MKILGDIYSSVEIDLSYPETLYTSQVEYNTTYLIIKKSIMSRLLLVISIFMQPLHYKIAQCTNHTLRPNLKLYRAPPLKYII